MNQETNHQAPNGAGAAALGFVMLCFILAGLMLAMKHFARPPAIDADQAVARGKVLADLRTAESNALNNAGWIDQNRGLVRLPISVALQITENEWQNPAAARSNLNARVEKATAPAPVAPAKPSVFE